MERTKSLELDSSQKSMLYPVLTVVLVIFLAAGVNCRVHALEVSVAARFTAYVFFGMLLPGYILCRLLRLGGQNDAGTIALSLGFGYSLSILQYLALMPMGLSMAMPFVCGMLAAICIVYLVWKSRGRGLGWRHIPSGEFGICMVFLVLVLVMEYYTVSLVYTLPGEMLSGNAYHADFLFWTGNNISAVKGFPLQDFRQVGVVFNYHYFSSLFLAHMSLVTGIDIVVLSVYFTNITAACMLVFCLYALLSTVLRERLYIAFGFILFLFADGTYASFESHTFFQPFGYDYGLAMGMLAIAALISMHKKNERNRMNYVVPALFLGVCTGSKGPIGVVVLMGFGAVSLLLIWEKKWTRAVLEGLLWLGVFLAVYLTFISGAYTSVGPSIDFIGISDALAENPYIKLVMEAHPGIAGLPWVVKDLTVILLYLFESSYVSNGLLVLSLVVLAAAVIKKKREEWRYLLLFCLMALWGNGLCLVFYMPGGGSQIYFLMATLPFAITGGLYSLQELNTHSIKLSMAAAMVTAAVFGFQFSKWLPKYTERVEVGKNLTTGARVFWSSTGMYCSNAQYEAYLWLRDNTDADAVIALDRLGTVEEYNNQREIAGVMSQRYVWNENYGVFLLEEAQERAAVIEDIVKLSEEKVELLASKGVGYFLQNKQYSQEDISESGGSEIVFDNEAFRIYKISSSTVAN